MQNDNKTKISCLPVSLYSDVYSGKLTVTGWSEKAAEAGLDFIDINALFLKDMPDSEIESIRSSLSLPVLMVSAYSDFTCPCDEKRREALETAVRDIENSAAIGAKYIRLTAGQHYTNCNDKVMLKNIYDCFEKCVPVAEKNGIKILLENHSKPGAWEYPDYVFGTERFLSVLQILSDLPVLINFDTANAYALNDWEKLLYASADKIATIHLNDLKSVSPLEFSLVGNGIVPLGEIVTEVFKIGFSGEICIEEASFTGFDGIVKAAEFTCKLLNK